MSKTDLALDYITINPLLQSRPLKKTVVNDYAEVLRRNGRFPPVRVVRDSLDTFYLVDGHHRYAAHKEVIGFDVVAAEIIEGTFDDALWQSWGANRGHGLRRTQEDKRRAIRAALRHPKWGQESDRAIAKHVDCDHKTVAAIRNKIKAGEFPSTCPRNRPASKAAILRACRLLSSIQPDQTFQFDPEEQGVIEGGSESLHRFLLAQNEFKVAVV